jgi:hypothetical protein
MSFLQNLGMALIYAELLLLVILCVQLSIGTYIAIIRPRSRHTAHFYPLDTWATPLLELSDLFGDEGCRFYFGHFEQLGSSIYKLPAHWANCTRLQIAIQNSILIHSLHKTYAYGDSPQETCRRAVDHFASTVSHSLSGENRRWFVSTVLLGNSLYSNSDIERNIISGFSELWQILGDENRVFYENNADLKYRIVVDEQSSPPKFILTTQLARGLAAELDDGRRLRDTLPSANSLRRPDSGVLKSFALARLPHRARTSMEPEIALLMSSFAKLRKNEGTSQKMINILDPYCGSCTLLLAAMIKLKGIISFDMLSYTIIVYFFAILFY